GWLGMKMESGGRPHPSPFVAVAVNSLNLGVENLQPPVFPLAGWWNEHAYKLLPQGSLVAMKQCFEPGAAQFWTMELQFEIVAGLGLGISLLLLGSWLGARSSPPGFTVAPGASAPSQTASNSLNSMHHSLYSRLVRWSALVSFLV